MKKLLFLFWLTPLLSLAQSGYSVIDPSPRINNFFIEQRNDTIDRDFRWANVELITCVNYPDLRPGSTGENRTIIWFQFLSPDKIVDPLWEQRLVIIDHTKGTTDIFNWDKRLTVFDEKLEVGQYSVWMIYLYDGKLVGATRQLVFYVPECLPEPDVQYIYKDTCLDSEVIVQDSYCKLKVSPNPSSGTIRVELICDFIVGEITFEIIDRFGRVIKSHRGYSTTHPFFDLPSDSRFVIARFVKDGKLVIIKQKLLIIKAE